MTGARYWDLGDSAQCAGLGLHRDQLLHIRIHHRTGSHAVTTMGAYRLHTNVLCWNCRWCRCFPPSSAWHKWCRCRATQSSMLWLQAWRVTYGRACSALNIFCSCLPLQCPLLCLHNRTGKIHFIRNLQYKVFWHWDYFCCCIRVSDELARQNFVKLQESKQLHRLQPPAKSTVTQDQTDASITAISSKNQDKNSQSQKKKGNSKKKTL